MSLDPSLAPPVHDRARSLVRRALCRCLPGWRLSMGKWPVPGFGHQWGHPTSSRDRVMVSRCLRLCGAVRTLPLDVPNGVRFSYATADPAKTRLEPRPATKAQMFWQAKRRRAS